MTKRLPTAALLVLLAGPASSMRAQGARSVAGTQRSANIHVVAHVPVGRATDIEIEQELSRPYSYIAGGSGFNVINLKDPAKASVLWTFAIENPEIHQGGALDNKYVKIRNRYYDVQSFQFRTDGTDADLGGIVFDMTGLPDTTKIKEVARLRTAEYPGGYHNIYAYKHSDGRALLFVTTNGPYALVYDMERVANGQPNAVVARIPRPDTLPGSPWYGYHDFYVGYDPATHQDRFYGAGLIGFYLFDITDLSTPKLLTQITGAAGLYIAHTFTPDPTGRYAVTETEYTYAPLRLYDLKPGLDGAVKNITRPVGAWTASWKGLVHNHEVRWPYVFVSGYGDEMQVFNMMDPSNPYTVGYYDTAPGVDLRAGSTWGVDVRNADGLIVTSDMRTGFWAFKMDGFDGWNGHQWGLPNISSVQDWDNGPEGAPKPQKVSVR